MLYASIPTLSIGQQGPNIQLSIVLLGIAALLLFAVFLSKSGIWHKLIKH